MAEDEKKYAFAVGHTRPFEETHPHLKTFVEFLEDFNKESERGAALSSTAYVDHLLERTLTAFLISNDSGFALTTGFNAPLGTFSARIAACHAMGLISEDEFKECNLLRRIRNKFAHEIRMSFKDQELVGLCSSLQFSAKPYNDVKVDARGKFTTSAVDMILRLTNRPHYVGQKALKYVEWKR